MRAIDTNILVRILVRDDQRQAALADACIAQGAWVSHLVLAEAFWVLESTYGHSKAAIAAALEMLLKHQSIIVQDDDVVLSALKRFKAHGKVGFTDCLILETARRAGHMPLSTFDRDLAKLEGAERL